MKQTTINKFDVGAEIAGAIGVALLIILGFITLGIWFLVDEMNRGSVGAGFVAGVILTLVILGFGWFIYMGIAWASEKLGSKRMKDNQQENERLMVLQHQIDRDNQQQLQNSLIAAKVATEHSRAGNQTAVMEMNQQKALMAQLADLRKENEALKNSLASGQGEQQPAWAFDFDEADVIDGDYRYG
ncbi:MAG: hypothetical protein IAF02_24845 [Anaerolineae bacterium]|nr:hypothetical protein [Anaerolineae bacterium]